MVRNKLIFLISAIALTAMFEACAPARTTVQDLKFDSRRGEDISSNLRLTLLETPEDNVLGTVWGIKSQDYTRKVAATHYAAAQTVFNRIGSISDKTTFSPHLVAIVKEATCGNSAFGAPCKASVDLYWGTGKFIRTYEAGKNATWTTMDSAVFYNCYVQIFKSIAEKMLSDESLSHYFEQGFDESLASATPNIPEIPWLQARIQREVEEAQRKAQAEANRRDSKVILDKVRSRGYASVNEIESIFSLGPNPTDLDALVLESLLPFKHLLYEAFELDDLKRVQNVCHHWRNWLERIRPHVSKEAEDSVQSQLSHLDKIDRQLSDPVLGKLTMKLAQAIKEERWEDAKNIQSLIRQASPPKPVVAETDIRTQNKYKSSSSEECKRAKIDYEQALAAYNSAKAKRNTRNNESAAAGLASLGKEPGALLMGFFANTTRNDARTAQNDMDHALYLLQDAKSRMTILCND